MPDFNEICIFSSVFRKIFKYQVSWKSVDWEPNCAIQTWHSGRSLFIILRTHLKMVIMKRWKSTKLWCKQTQFCVFRVTRSADNIIASYTKEWARPYQAQSSKQKTPLNKWKWLWFRSIKMWILQQDLMNISLYWFMKYLLEICRSDTTSETAM
jgi:hypothetical protein